MSNATVDWMTHVDGLVVLNVLFDGLGMKLVELSADRLPADLMFNERVDIDYSVADGQITVNEIRRA